MSHGTGALTDSEWSVVEGDEYQISIGDKRPKFACYSPSHLLLTSVSWDHADLYPTEDLYFKAFEKLIADMPPSGLIVAQADNAGISRILKTSKPKQKVITYGENDGSDYRLQSVVHSKSGLSFSIEHGGKEFAINSPMLGRFNAENIAGTFAMANEIGIPADMIIAAIAGFKGIKRRLERRLEGDVDVLDCHAPTPEKASSVLESIREIYDERIIAVYEPNIGGRQKKSAFMYDGAFKCADAVIIPRLTKLKVAEDQTDMPLEGEELAKIIGKTHADVRYVAEDGDLVNLLSSETKKGDVIVFLGSHGFRGMIEEAMNKLGSNRRK